jgi:hypothetical protein
MLMADIVRLDAIAAKQISVSCCSHGHIYVKLHDDKGQVFAYAPIHKRIASALIDNLFDAMDGVNAAPCKEKHR